MKPVAAAEIVLALLAVGTMTGLAACGHVAANYPAADSASDVHTIDTEAAVTCGNDVFTFRIGNLWDRDQLVSAKRQTDEQMRQAMGDAAFAAMDAQVRAANPWVARFETFTNHSFYRAALEFKIDRPVVVEKGVLILTIISGNDTVSVRDDGIAFFKHESSPLSCLFSHDGPIRYERRWNDLPLGAENRCNVLVPVRGTVIAAELDPKRYRVISP